MNHADQNARLQAVLLSIAERFNAASIPWGLGASMLLWFHGIVDAPADIDLLVAAGYADQADAVLRDMGTKSPPGSNVGYATRFFGEYAVRDVDADLMEGFAIRYGDGQCYRYPFDPGSLEKRDVLGVSIYLTPLLDWYVLYQLMPGREKRITQLEAYLWRHGVKEAGIRKWMREPIPAAIRERLAGIPIATHTLEQANEGKEVSP